MISSLLIANRGEISCRVICTARAMGIRTVAVYSDADAKALHVRQADEAVHIGPSPAAESYLVGEKIIAAAKETGAEAIHPGYGFLSENADFAQAVVDAGLIWVGPSPESIRAMGLKDAAKQLMTDAGVPVTPGYSGEDQSERRLVQEAEAIGYPVLIKAVAGGGGKGMRLVEGTGDFAAALESCKREAKASFDNDHVLLEKFVANPRHIEVQVFGDTHGDVIHLFERDCSLQRRHQKVIEEAPAPGMDEATRAAICAAAVKAAKAVDYVGAGTVEFIADASEGLSADRIWFMEMNTRLQVEHPVTEEITGVDLVEWQLRVASGEELPLKQDELSITGHAIEARLYAEDPAKRFLPSTGQLDELLLDDRNARIESGVEPGDRVTPFYDPMIAKIICHGPSRDAARHALMDTLNSSLVWPVTTNKGFLYECLDDADFAAGQIDTGLIERKGDALLPGEAPSQEAADVAASRLRFDFLDWERVSLDGPEAEFRGVVYGFRLNAPAARFQTLWCGGHEMQGDTLAEETLASSSRPECVALVTERGQDRAFTARPPRTNASSSASSGAILAPMPGKVIALDVVKGQEVAKGERLMVLEAMKMEHALTAPFAGRVADLPARLGAQVEVEALLAQIEQEEG